MGLATASRIGIALIAIGFLAALTSTAGSAGISDGARTEASSIMSDRCAVCHGETGDGNGPGAANLNPKPKDFHNRKWQRSVSDDTLAKAIVNGGPAVGLSDSMPGNPDLVNRPDVVAALIETIRKLSH